MADPSGYGIKAAIRRPVETSPYGTEAASIGNQIPLLSESMTTKPELVISEAVVGNASVQDVATAALSPSGTITTELWYEGLEYLWASALGFESPDPATTRGGANDSTGSPALNDATPESFLHLFEPDENLHREPWGGDERIASIPATDWEWDGNDQKVRAFSLAIDKGVGSPSVEHFVDCMVQKFTIKGGHGKPLTVDWDLVARSSSMVGTSSAFALPSYGPPRPALFPQVKFYLSSIFDSLNQEIPITEFEISFDNGLSVDDYDTGGNDLTAGLSYRTEPVRKDQRRVSMKIKFARMNSSTVWPQTYFGTDAPVQARLAIVGPDITDSAFPFRYGFAIPTAKVLSANFPAAGPGVITGDAEIMAYKPPSSAYDQTWVEDEFDGVKRKKKNEFFVALNNTRGASFLRDANSTYPLP